MRDRSILLLDVGVFAPAEAAAEDAFDDEVVGGGGGADADADVDLPIGGDVEIGDGEELLLLVVDGAGGGDAAIVGVVLKAGADDGGEVVTDFEGGREADALVDVGAVESALEGGIE